MKIEVSPDERYVLARIIEERIEGTKKAEAKRVSAGLTRGGGDPGNITWERRQLEELLRKIEAA